MITLRVRRRLSKTVYDVQIATTYLDKYVAQDTLKMLYPDHPYGEVWAIDTHLSKIGKIERYGYRVSPGSTRRIYPPRKPGKRYPHVLSPLRRLGGVTERSSWELGDHA